MKKKFSVFFMVVAITIFNFMPIMCVNAEDTDSQIIRTTTTNYHTRVIGTLNITGTDTYSKNYDSGETYIDGNYTDANVEAIINGYKDDMSSIAESYNRATYSIIGGINDDYYYDAHDEITQSGTCPTDLDGALSAYPDCTITINTVLDKYQTYKLTANATTKNIKEININLTAPTVGEKVTLIEDTSIICLDTNGCWTADKTPTATTSDNITIDDTAWVMGTYPEYGDGFDNFFEGTFEKDKYYYAMISISAKDGYKLSSDLTIKVNGELSKLTGIKVDGTLIDEENYTLESGSTILTLKSSYLNTLSVGEHTLTFVYNDGSVDTTFSISNTTTDTTTTSNPQTGDNINLFIVLGTLSLIGLSSSLIYLKRRKENV